MTATLTLENIPEAVYARLQAAAETHGRSLSSEAIVCLEAALPPRKPPPSERLAHTRKLRAALPQKSGFRAEDMDAAKRQGRP